MKTSSLDDPHPVGQSGHERDDGIIEIGLEHRCNVKFEPAALREIA